MWSACGPGTASSTWASRSSGLEPVAEGLVREHDAVPEDVGSEVAHVVSAHVAAPRSRASTRAAWTSPTEPRGLAPNSIMPSRSARPCAPDGGSHRRGPRRSG